MMKTQVTINLAQKKKNLMIILIKSAIFEKQIGQFCGNL